MFQQNLASCFIYLNSHCSRRSQRLKLITHINDFLLLFMSCRKERRAGKRWGLRNQSRSRSPAALQLAATGLVPVARVWMAGAVSRPHPARCVCASAARTARTSHVTSCGSSAAAAARASAGFRESDPHPPSAFTTTYTPSLTEHTLTHNAPSLHNG